MTDVIVMSRALMFRDRSSHGLDVPYDYISQRDFIHAAKQRASDVVFESITKHCKAGTFTYHAKHRLKSSKDILVHGVLLQGKCDTHALIPPDLSPSSGMATASTSSTLSIESDPEFADPCRKATIFAIHGYQEAEAATLRRELTSIPCQFHKLPFHDPASCIR